MDDKIFWNTPKIVWGDLPTVHDLLRCADHKLLAQIFVDEYAKSDPPSWLDSSKSRKDKIKRTQKVIRRLLETSHKKSKKTCIFPYGRYQMDIRTRTIQYSIGVCALKRSDFDSMCTQSKDIGLVPRTPTPWEDTVGFRVWLGGNLSRRERYMALVSIVWSLTCMGATQKKTKETVDDILEKAERICEVLSPVPPEVFVKDYGLEPPADDLDAEYLDRLSALEEDLNHNASIAMFNEVSHLNDMLKRGYQ